jgi:thiol-disulfide isomerase/thioredoxin
VIARRFLVVLAAAVAIAGCGSGARSDPPSKVSITSAFKDSPAPLASLHAQANQLLGGGGSAFKARLRDLRGYPVVVNVWASWCEPCQSEFPVYQRVSVLYGRRVAFLGIDAKDSNANASTFLRHYPVTYPSYTDPQGHVEASMNVVPDYPQTLYFSRSGTMVYDNAGPYLKDAALEKDIRFYLHVT